jgi:hypothetical protein
MIDGKIVIKMHKDKTYSEEEYKALVQEYNDLAREYYRLKTVCRDLLNENINYIDELNKLTGTEKNTKDNWNGTGFFVNTTDDYK